MRSSLFISAVAVSLLVAFPRPVLSAPSTLAIIGAGVQAAEDAPFVSADYRFLPGDFVYFTFEITGFGVSDSKDDVRSISLVYQAAPEDAAGTPLVKPVTGKIEAILHPQDKDWTPKRRASFLLPSFVAAGAYRIHVSVTDSIGKSQTAADFPFEIGGVEVKPSAAITVENFRFLRNADDSKALAVPAYSPGDRVFARFDMVGYKLGPENSYDVAYGLTVLGPNGKPFIQQPQAAQLKSSSFYPAQFVPGLLDLTTSRNTARGEYVIVLRARDLTGNRSYEMKQAFTVE